MGFTTKEVGRMTLTFFNRCYDNYKNEYDREMLLEKTGTTYQKAWEKSQETDKYF